MKRISLRDLIMVVGLVVLPLAFSYGCTPPPMEIIAGVPEPGAAVRVMIVPFAYEYQDDFWRRTPSFHATIEKWQRDYPHYRLIRAIVIKEKVYFSYQE